MPQVNDPFFFAKVSLSNCSSGFRFFPTSDHFQLILVACPLLNTGIWHVSHATAERCPFRMTPFFDFWCGTILPEWQSVQATRESKCAIMLEAPAILCSVVLWHAWQAMSCPPLALDPMCTSCFLLVFSRVESRPACFTASAPPPKKWQ